MESIKYTPECVQKSEEDDHSALAHRDRVLEHFSTAPGLGPIDLVVCRKAGKGAFGEQHASFFHQVLGHDLTSTASAAAYFAELCNSTEEVGFIPGLFTAHQWKVTQCVYCCFDAFSRLDVRCHMSVPGGVTAYAVDSKGQRYDMTTAHWKRVSVSAFLRYEYYHPSIFRGIPGVVHRQGVRTPDAEEAILDSIVDLYYDRVPPEVLNMLRPGGQRGGALPEDNDPMLAAVLQHFRRRRVLEGAVEFFTQVASLHAPAVVHLCCALEALGRTEDALQVLRSNALRMPQDTNIICALAAAEAAIGSQQDALQLARHALLLAPKSTTALLCMARMQALCGAPALAVLAMHLVVPPSDPSVLIRRIFPCGLPPHDRVTAPVCKRWPLEEQEVTVLEEEMNFPKRFDQATNWLRVVKQLCGIADDGSHDELPYIPPDVHSDTSMLHTSIVRLLPYIQGMQYQVITMCMKEVGMHNFMRILQALSRTATEKATKEAAPQDLTKAALSTSDKPAQKRRSKRSTAAFKPLSARQRSGSTMADISRDAGWAPSQAASVEGSSTEVAAAGASAEPAGGTSTASLPAVSGAASTAETDAEASAPVESLEPVEEPAVDTSEATEVPVSDVNGAAEFAPGNAPEAESVRDSAEQLADDGDETAEIEDTAVMDKPAQPQPPAVVADLSRVPADLVAGDSRVRHQPDPDGHPVAEGLELQHVSFSGSGELAEHVGVWLASLTTVQDASVADSSEAGFSPCSGDKASHVGEGGRRGCCRAWRSGGMPVGEAVKRLSQHSLLPPLEEQDSAQDEDLPARGTSRSPVAVGEAPESVQAGSGAAVAAAAGGTDMPLEVLRDALHRMESGSPGVTAERLGRLQLRAQEHAARVVTSNTLRSRQFKKLQLGGARQRRDGAAATSEGQKDSGNIPEDVGPVAMKIVDHAKLTSTSEQLMEEAKQRKSTRHAESLQASLLVATTAPPGAIQEVSMNVAHLVTMVLQDLDDASHVHSAAVHESSDMNAKGLLAAAEQVQHNCNQFLQFQHHPLGGAALPDASVTEGATVGDWLTWAGACERLGCDLHARYAYTKALVLVQPHRCLTAHMGIARLVASEADVHTVFDHLTEVLLLMDHRRDQVMGTAEAAHGVIKEGQVSSSIVSVLATVIDAWGMSAVQNRLEKGSGQYHPSIDPIVEQAFGWGTDGCDA